MRLKALPEDFLVEEKIHLPLDPAGKHSIFRIRKRDTTTLQVQESLALLLHVGKEQITFPALKDKDAIATQFVSVAWSPQAALPSLAPSAAFSIDKNSPFSQDDYARVRMHLPMIEMETALGATETEVHHGGRRPSKLVLPVVKLPPR